MAETRVASWAEMKVLTTVAEMVVKKAERSVARMVEWKAVWRAVTRAESLVG